MNIRQLRDTRRLKAWLRAGNTVELRERDRVIAHIVPEGQAIQTAEWPDFKTRRKQVFGGQAVSIVDDLARDRGRY